MNTNPNPFKVLPLFLLLLCGSTLSANIAHKLNPVWTRMADLFGEYGSVESAEFSPDSQFIATGSKYDNTVRVFRTVDGHLIWTVQLPAEIERVAWTGDGRQVTSVSEDRVFRVFNAEDGSTLHEKLHTAPMDSLALSNNGRLMAVGQEHKNESSKGKGDGTAPVVLYDTRTWEEVLRVDQRTTANEIAFTPEDSHFIVVGFHNFKSGILKRVS